MTMCIQAFWTEISADRLNTVLDDLLEELKITKRQRIREIMKRPEQETLIQSSQNREDKVFRVHVISNGDPLEIYTSKDGEVIFKKYSPISELGSIAAQYCEVLYRTAGYPVLITDRDHVVAVGGISRRDVLERRVSHGLEDQIENRRSFSAGDGQPLQPIEGVAYYALVQSPIISSGDVCGSVMFLQNKESDRPGDAEQKLIQAAASYLGKQMEL